ncbi:hypothetical protein [Streptomyces sp. NPDC060198]|uniref:hypothetical protein n=1 Tax=Streptomyces sp. NPDC060198 TaxID=3347070 RepID=UPI00364E2CEA
MADVELKKAAANAAIDDMGQANAAMTAALQDMLDRIRPLQQSFSGDSAQAWAEFQGTVNAAINKMNTTFTQGTQALTSMVDLQIQADLAGGRQLSAQ